MSKKIDQFTELAAQPANTDLFLLELASNGQYRKIKWQNVVADGSITTTKLAGSAVTSSKINFGGAGAGLWWEEIARTTLTVAGNTITVNSIPARNYLKILVYYTATGGTANATVKFNNDTGTNYAARYSDNGAADTTTASTASIPVDAGAVAVYPNFLDFELINYTALEKVWSLVSVATATAGAATIPNRRIQTGKWANTAAQISRVDITNASGTGNFAIGSEVIILGHN